MKNPQYIVDASILMRRENGEIYDEKSFPTHWNNFDKLVKQGKIISVDKVKNELLDNGHDFFKDWIKEHDFMFKPDYDSETLKILKELDSLFHKWYVANKKADPILIAQAKSKNLILVTHESISWGNNDIDAKDPKEYKKYKIHDICYRIGANCIAFDNPGPFCKNESFSFECICFNELVKREKLYENK